MHRRYLGLMLLCVISLTSCTLQLSIPPLAESRPTETTSTSRADSAAPTTIADSPIPSEQSVEITPDRPGECPLNIVLPDGVDHRACGPIPDDASNGYRGERFITPSGNIACRMNEATVICEALDTVMISDFHNPEGDGQCNGFLLERSTSLLCHSELALWGEPGALDWPELPYGESVFVFEQICAVDNQGLTCWNSESGHGFFLSRSRYSHW